MCLAKNDFTVEEKNPEPLPLLLFAWDNTRRLGRIPILRVVLWLLGSFSCVIFIFVRQPVRTLRFLARFTYLVFRSLPQSRAFRLMGTKFWQDSSPRLLNGLVSPSLVAIYTALVVKNVSSRLQEYLSTFQTRTVMVCANSHLV